jgi:predicted O-linked N-acetylglucosamine transferase (SPINDLY family)
LTARLRTACQGWCDVAGLSDERLARQIHDDRIDILVDLSGHTGHGRLPVFAWKAAPVQVTWLGYWATTGVSQIDYLIADPWTLPPEEEANFTEQVWRLPETRLCFTPPDVDVPVSPLPALARGQVTFASFSNAAKLNDAVISAWAAILGRVTGSRLLLKAKQFEEALVRESFTERFRQAGIDPARLVFEGRSPRRDYLAAYSRADIVLDPFPFPGGTTTAESLWMGVPVLTLAGQRFVSRQGVGLLTNAGLPDWVAHDVNNYVEKAAYHATHLDHLAELRTRLRNRVLNSPVFDAQRFAGHLGDALRRMWKIWCDMQQASSAAPAPRSKANLQQSESGSAKEATSLCARARALVQENRLEDALDCYRRALATEASQGQGELLLRMGRLPEARASFAAVLAARPRSIEALTQLARVLLDMNELDAAVGYLQQACSLDPGQPETHANLGNALARLGRLDAAESSYRRALNLRPSFHEVQNNLGTVLAEAGRFEDAIECYCAALQIEPDFVQGHVNLGNALSQLGQSGRALNSYRKALSIDPKSVKALYNMGNTLKELGPLDAALASYRRALALQPDFPEVLTNVLFTLNYRKDASPSSSLLEAKAYGAMVNRHAREYSDWNVHPKAERRLKIGLVSADIRNHPVGFFLESILEQFRNDETKLDIHVYCNSLRSDDVTERVRGYCSAWHGVTGLSDSQLAKRIHNHAIDLLVDLSGHTAGTRLGAFAWKPAPVQVTWLGYFATTGVAQIDYLIADSVTLLHSQEPFYTEKIWRLPETRLCFTAPNIKLEVGPLPCLSSGHVTFGCFSNAAKLNAEVLSTWARILQQVPASRLLLKAKQFVESSVREQVVHQFEILGITPDRVSFEEASSRPDYLAAYHRVDITLDPFPFTGGTTTAESLWMGVPVLTLAGERMVERQGVGLLTNAGLPDWVAQDESDYVRRAIQHASDLQGLAELRGRLRAQVLASPVFDAPRMARNLEAAFRGMWARWCATRHA